MTNPAALTVTDWHRLNRLLADALELDAPARIGWLDALPVADRHLLPVLSDLLRRSDDTGFAGDAQPPTTVARAASAALAAMRREQPGDRIGPWRLERLLAEGGMGAVWLAQRADGVIDRTVAIKLPKSDWVDRGLAERIARERAILARLQHPNIALLYDAGLSPAGRPYLALEYVDGVPIDAACRQRDLRWIVSLLVQVVRAVAFAHAQLVIHRDLKPSNVLVRADGVPKLLDFGISKILEPETPAVEETALTRMAGRRLTLAYAAPEQILGQPISTAADVYALGVMLFELTAGVRLYRAEGAHELEAEILRGVLRRPSDAARDKARAGALREDLDAIIGRALRRAPEERYQGAAALADDLERYLGGEPVKARPDSRTYRLKKFVARNRLPVAAAGAVALALGVGLGVALWQAGVARDQAARATAMNDFVLSLIRRADPNASPQVKAADLAILAEIEQRIDGEFKGSPDQLLQLRVTVGDAYFNRGELAIARRVFRRAIDEAAPLLPADDLQLLTARVRAANYELIVSAATAAELDQSIAILRRQGARGADLLIDALIIRNELAQLYGVPEFTPPAQRFDAVNEAFGIATRYFGAGSRQQLRAVRPLAEMTDRFRPAPEAGRLLESALASARERTDGADASAEYRDANSVYAAHLCTAARVPEGLALIRASTDSVRKAYGENSVQLERLLLARSDCDDPADETLPYEIFKIAAARERPPSINLMERAEAALDVAMSMRDYATAERYYQSAVENSVAIADADLRAKLTRTIVANRVCLLAFRGDADEAEAAAAPLAAAADADYGRLNRMWPGQGALWPCLSFAQRQNGRFAAAIASARTFVERARAMKFSTPNEVGEFRSMVAQALAELDAGRPADALATIEQRLAYPHELSRDPNLALAAGRAFLANGRPQEAVKALNFAYATTRSFPAATGLPAEAAYWLGHALIAAGEPRRGRPMVADAKRALAASPLKSHRRLAADRSF